MRVISQDGTMDFPYEISTIFIYPSIENVIAIQSAGDSEISIIGRYSSKEKTIKAMEMLRERHTDNVFCREDIQYKAEIMLDEGLNIVREMMMKCEYFQCPQDDEIEV